jgi:hypothetical protein
MRQKIGVKKTKDFRTKEENDDRLDCEAAAIVDPLGRVALFLGGSIFTGSYVTLLFETKSIIR